MVSIIIGNILCYRDKLGLKEKNSNNNFDNNFIF